MKAVDEFYVLMLKPVTDTKEKKNVPNMSMYYHKAKDNHIQSEGLINLFTLTVVIFMSV